VQSAEFIYEMAQGIGKPFSVGMYLISPFTCPPEGLAIVDAFLERRVPMWIGTMPIAGLNAPIFMLGAHVQALAELMAGTALLTMLSEGQVPVFWTPIDSVRAHPFDMRYAAFVFGSAEDQLGTVLQAQINDFYGVPLVAKSLLTTAHELDEQAAAEKASHTLLAALAGARMFTNAGFLAIDNYVSPVQMVIDHEIVAYVQHVISGLQLDEQALGTAVIEEVVGSGSDFLGHNSTHANFRTQAWYPDLFEHVNYPGQDAEKRASLLERARAIAQDLIYRGDYVLPESERAILDSIYRRAERGIEEPV
jgi:trimethylamine:corrinoid methyltransferase-like protein